MLLFNYCSCIKRSWYTHAPCFPILRWRQYSLWSSLFWRFSSLRKAYSLRRFRISYFNEGRRPFNMSCWDYDSLGTFRDIMGALKTSAPMKFRPCTSAHNRWCFSETFCYRWAISSASNNQTHLQEVKGLHLCYFWTCAAKGRGFGGENSKFTN